MALAISVRRGRHDLRNKSQVMRFRNRPSGRLPFAMSERSGMAAERPPWGRLMADAVEQTAQQARRCGKGLF